MPLLSYYCLNSLWLYRLINQERFVIVYLESGWLATLSRASPSPPLLPSLFSIPFHNTHIVLSARSFSCRISKLLQLVLSPLILDQRAAADKIQRQCLDPRTIRTPSDWLFMATYDHSSMIADCSSCGKSQLIQRAPQVNYEPHIHSRWRAYGLTFMPG